MQKPSPIKSSNSSRRADHSNISLLRYAGADLWLVYEYVMRGELIEGHVCAVERVTCQTSAHEGHRLCA
jgi:hypothetical protein